MSNLKIPELDLCKPHTIIICPCCGTLHDIITGTHSGESSHFCVRCGISWKSGTYYPREYLVTIKGREPWEKECTKEEAQGLLAAEAVIGIKRLDIKTC